MHKPEPRIDATHTQSAPQPNAALLADGQTDALDHGTTIDATQDGRPQTMAGADSSRDAQPTAEPDPPQVEPVATTTTLARTMPR